MSRTTPSATALVTAVLAAAVLVGGCDRTSSPTTSTAATPATAGPGIGDGTCDPVEHPPVQLSQHLIGDAAPPGEYSSTPPTSGWHTSSVPEPGRATGPLRDAEIVAALERGIVVATVDPDVLDLDDAVVDGLVDQFPDRLVVTAYDADLPRPVTLLTWGALQRCDDLDPAAVTSFVLTERAVLDAH